MGKKKIGKEENNLGISEPELKYSSVNSEKGIQIFSSFEEENEFVSKERFILSYDERMLNVEILRKNIFNEYLLPDGTWPSIANVFKVMPPYTNEISK